MQLVNHTPCPIALHPPAPGATAFHATLGPHRDTAHEAVHVTARIPLLARLTHRWHPLDLVPVRSRSWARASEKRPLIHPHEDGRPWRFQAFYKSHANAPPTVLVIPTADPSTHLSALPDHVSLGDIVLPGTHQSLARHGCKWERLDDETVPLIKCLARAPGPFSQCQTSESTIDVQLAQGIRFFDIRLRVQDGALLAYHGPWPQHTPFRSVLASVLAFLDAHPRETLITCIQQESSRPDARFSALVRHAMEPSIGAGKWYLENRIPQLGVVRGRAILMSRFGGSSADGGTAPWLVPPPPPPPPPGDDQAEESRVLMGWRPERWPYSALDGFEWHDDAGVTCRTQDWCEIYGFFNVAAKFTVLTEHLTGSTSYPPSRSLTLSYASGASLPLAPPPLVARGFGIPSWGLGIRGVNDRLRAWMLDRLAEGGALRGIVPLDFYRGGGGGLVDPMVAFNLVSALRERE